MKKRNMFIRIVDAVAVRATAPEIYVVPLLRRILIGLTNVTGNERRIIITRVKYHNKLAMNPKLLFHM